jgi:peroxiredoxin-like protein
VQPLPHRYAVSAEAAAEGTVRLASPGLAELESAPPVEFDGPGDRWSPETLLLAAVADCFVLTFRAVARASAYAWTRLACDAEGVLERTSEGVRFTTIRLRAELEAPAGSDAARGERLLAKAERGCLVSRSLKTEVELEARVRTP